jgi:hypothetical protein
MLFLVGGQLDSMLSLGEGHRPQTNSPTLRGVDECAGPVGFVPTGPSVFLTALSKQWYGPYPKPSAHSVNGPRGRASARPLLLVSGWR